MSSSSLKIFLHVAIPSDRENEDIPMSPFQRFKMRLHHRFDWLVWKLLRIYRFKSHNYSTRQNCNKGDIAIKLAIKELIARTMDGYPVTFVETEWGCLNENILELVNRRAAVFVVAGGGYWVFNDKGRLSPSFPADLPFFARMQCPIAVFGSGVNFNMPTPDPAINLEVDAERRALFLALDQHAELVGLRGETSVEFFNRLGVTKARLVPDPAVFLWPTELPPETSSGTLRIGVNLAFHGSFMESSFREVFEAYVAVLKRIQAKYKPVFHYFVHSDHERIFPKLFRASGIPMRVVDCDSRELVAWYGRMDAVICQMMHSNILSFNAGTPALNIGYDAKNFEFNRMIGMQEYCLTALHLPQESFDAKASALIENRKQLAERLARRKGELFSKLEDFLAEFRSLAGSQAPTAVQA